ncbi:unnamed protein product [Clonostachys byssicola]|uniref:Uncharacterized protein n=1 Tax=Clonostachys byssicola TaxID=160290 RepID=A0A9N9Y0H6_9HYPO|nr:unnamed protein product [Clonostachys byssicola]
MFPRKLFSKYYGYTSATKKTEEQKARPQPIRTTSSYNYMPLLDPEDYMEPSTPRYAAVSC